MAGQDKNNYYAGSSELATETPVTVKRLETRRLLTKNSTKLVIVLVGLPARGKSFVARKMLHYLNWSGCKCKIFNVGKYRREAYKHVQSEAPTADGDSAFCDANFFDTSNAAASKLREKVAEAALIDMLRWLDEPDDAEESDNSGNGHFGFGLNGHHRSPSESRHGSEHFMSDLSKHSSTSLASFGNQGHGAKLNFKRYDRIAIFDATNSTNKRRQWVLEQCTSPEKRGDKPTGVVFVESICDDQELLEENYNYKVSNSPDYVGMSKEESLADLRNRVSKYEEQYETITDDSQSYIKVYNLSTKLLMNHIYGRMAKELVPALMAWHIGTRPVFLCRPGQTITGITTDGEDYVARSKVDPSDPRFLDMSSGTKRKNMRGDSLGPTGLRFRADLLDFCYEESTLFMLKRASVHDMKYTGTSISGVAPMDFVKSQSDNTHKDPFPLRILTSTMPRAVDTVNWDEFQFLPHEMSNLNPLDKGDFAGVELDEIRKKDQCWYSKLERDPFGTRFPGGESYRDLIRRLTNVVIDLEQQVMPTLVVSHVSILQCLIAYFRNTPVERCMSIDVPMHTVFEFTPVRGGGWKETRHALGQGSNNNMQPVQSTGELSLSSSPPDDVPPIWGDGMPISPVHVSRCLSSS